MLWSQQKSLRLRANSCVRLPGSMSLLFEFGEPIGPQTSLATWLCEGRTSAAPRIWWPCAGLVFVLILLNAAAAWGEKTMEIGIHEPNKLPVIVSLLLAILAIIAQFVASPAAFWIAIFAYVVGALGILVKT
jgi:hypothetical protein